MPARSRWRRSSPSASPTRTASSDIGELKIKICGCINACGHHHAGNIGILGVDKKGTESYQLLLGGSGDGRRHAGQDHRPRLRRGRDRRRGRDARSSTTARMREDGERFIDTYRRVGMEAFKEAIYG